MNSFPYKYKNRLETEERKVSLEKKYEDWSPAAQYIQMSGTIYHQVIRKISILKSLL